MRFELAQAGHASNVISFQFVNLWASYLFAHASLAVEKDSENRCRPVEESRDCARQEGHERMRVVTNDFQRIPTNLAILVIDTPPLGCENIRP